MRKGNVEHPMGSNKRNGIDLPAGVSKAIDKVKEFETEEISEKKATTEDISVPKNIKDLALFGRIVEEVNLGGYLFKIKTLTSREQRDIVSKVMKLNGDERFLNMQIFVLAKAIDSVNGVPLEEIYDKDDNLSIEQKRFEVVSDLQSTLVDKLLKRYDKMVEKANKVIADGGVEEQIKN